MFFDVVPLRLLPALLAATIVYPMTGLRHDAPDWSFPSSRWPGPAAAAMFVVGLCLVNIVAATMTSALGIVCRSSGVAMMLAVLLTLFTMLFSGLLVNPGTMATHAPPWLRPLAELLPACSFMYYFIEMVLFNELHDQTITIDRPQDNAVTALGYDVLYQLGYANHSSYWLPGHNAGRLCWLDMPCVGVHDLTVLAIWSVCGVLSCFLLLRFCVWDPH